MTMQYRRMTYMAWEQTLCVLLLWMVSGLSGSATGKRMPVCDMPVLTWEQKTAPGQDQGMGAYTDPHHQCARIAEGITLAPAGGQTGLSRSQVRPGHRMSGGRAMDAATATGPRQRHAASSAFHFTLASSGVAFITSRACDYYVFALRRILD